MAIIRHGGQKTARREAINRKTKVIQIYLRIWVTYSTLLYPVSLLIGCWDWVQGGDPLYAAVKCLSGCWGQIWRNFSIFFAKRTWHTHFLTGKFFSETKNNFFPPKLAVLGGGEMIIQVLRISRTLNFWKRTLNFWKSLSPKNHSNMNKRSFK